MQKRKLIRYLLLPVGIIGFLVISLVVPLSYTPDTSVPFPYIPPPEGSEGYYIKTSVNAIETSLFNSRYLAPFDADGYKGQSFIFKRVELTKWYLESKSTETCLATDMIQFAAQNPPDLKNLKVGDKIDIIGICAGMLEGYRVVVFRDCQILPAGLAPLPLPGGPVFVGGY